MKRLLQSGTAAGRAQHCAGVDTNANALPHAARAICQYDVPADRRGRTPHFNSGHRAITPGWSACVNRSQSWIAGKPQVEEHSGPEVRFWEVLD